MSSLLFRGLTSYKLYVELKKLKKIERFMLGRERLRLESVFEECESEK